MQYCRIDVWLMFDRSSNCFSGAATLKFAGTLFASFREVHLLSIDDRARSVYALSTSGSVGKRFVSARISSAVLQSSCGNATQPFGRQSTAPRSSWELKHSWMWLGLSFSSMPKRSQKLFTSVGSSFCFGSVALIQIVLYIGVIMACAMAAARGLSSGFSGILSAPMGGSSMTRMERFA